MSTQDGPKGETPDRSGSSFRECCPEVAHAHPIYLGLYLRSAVQSAEHRVNRDFVVVDGKIVIVDVDNTGRLKQRTHWANGLHEMEPPGDNMGDPETSIALEGAFQRSFGISPGETAIYDERFMVGATSLFEMYRAALIRQQLLLRRLDSEKVEGLVNDLAQKVSRMTQDCVSSFKKASELDIKRFLDEDS